VSAPDVSPPEQLAQLVGVRSELATALATALHEARSNPTGYPLRQAIEGALTELAALQKLAKSWRVESAPPAGPSAETLANWILNVPDVQVWYGETSHGPHPARWLADYLATKLGVSSPEPEGNR